MKDRGIFEIKDQSETQKGKLNTFFSFFLIGTFKRIFLKHRFCSSLRNTGPTAKSCIQKKIFFFHFLKSKCKNPLEIEDDNPRQFDQVLCRSVNVKNAKVDWTRIAMFSSLLLSSAGFGYY